MQTLRRVPSRRMPADESHALGKGCVFLLGIVPAAGVVALCFLHWSVICVVLAVASIVMIALRLEEKRQQRIRKRREGESICTFARAIDCRRVDTWIVRAVYESISELIHFPIRPDDDLNRDLTLDSDDLDEIAEHVAARTLRPLKQVERNPMYSKVNTVNDLIEFFVHQPKHETFPRPGGDRILLD